MAQLDPPHWASRYFGHGGVRHSVQPDAFGVLRHRGRPWACSLEWERRAVRPSWMAARLAPYLRYYASPRPTDGHGVRPAVLAVFEDDIAAAHFLRVARKESARARVELPLRVSHRTLIEREGPLGHAWRAPAGEPPVPVRLSRSFPTSVRPSRPTRCVRRRRPATPLQSSLTVEGELPADGLAAFGDDGSVESVFEQARQVATEGEALLVDEDWHAPEPEPTAAAVATAEPVPHDDVGEKQRTLFSWAEFMAGETPEPEPRRRRHKAPTLSLFERALRRACGRGATIPEHPAVYCYVSKSPCSRRRAFKCAMSLEPLSLLQAGHSS